MMWRIGCLLTLGLGMIVCVIPGAEDGHQLSLSEMREITGGQLGGDERNSKKCAHIDHGQGIENPCVASLSCPTDIENCVGEGDFVVSGTFWKCIPWIFYTSTCTLPAEGGACVYRRTCTVQEGVCTGDEQGQHAIAYAATTCTNG